MPEYRVRETLIYVRDDAGVHCERGYIAERHLLIFGLLSIWRRVLNARWRPTVQAAEHDAQRDAELRRPGRVVRLYEVFERA